MYIIGGFDGKFSKITLIGEYLNEIWKFDFENYTLKMVESYIDKKLKRSNQTAVYYAEDRW